MMYAMGIITGIALCGALFVMEVLFIKNKHVTPLEAFRKRVEGKRVGVILENERDEDGVEEWVDKLGDDFDGVKEF